MGCGESWDGKGVETRWCWLEGGVKRMAGGRSGNGKVMAGVKEGCGQEVKREVRKGWGMDGKMQGKCKREAEQVGAC